MLHVVLVSPEIATNTGNIVRLCANTGARLHLVEPLGFSLEDRYLRRAGLDYRELAQVACHSSLNDCLATVGSPWERTFALSSRGDRAYDSVEFFADDVVVFGAERAGLEREILERFDDEHRLRIPMRAGNRSLNLANAVAVVVYEAWRQSGFADAGSDPSGDSIGSLSETLSSSSYDVDPQPGVT